MDVSSLEVWLAMRQEQYLTRELDLTTGCARANVPQSSFPFSAVRLDEECLSIPAAECWNPFLARHGD